MELRGNSIGAISALVCFLPMPYLYGKKCPDKMRPTLRTYRSMLLCLLKSFLRHALTVFQLPYQHVSPGSRIDHHWLPARVMRSATDLSAAHGIFEHLPGRF